MSLVTPNLIHPVCVYLFIIWNKYKVCIFETMKSVSVSKYLGIFFYSSRIFHLLDGDQTGDQSELCIRRVCHSNRYQEGHFDIFCM